MQKRPFRTKIIAVAAACAMSAGMVALSAAPAQANTGTTGTSETTVDIQNNVLCNYTVNASGGLWVRDAPNGNLVRSLANGSNVLAYQNRTQTANGIVWRQLSDGNWSAASYLMYDGSNCMV